MCIIHAVTCTTFRYRYPARKGSNPLLKAKWDQHRHKVMTLFFDCLGHVRIEFLSEGVTANAERHVQTLRNLKRGHPQQETELSEAACSPLRYNTSSRASAPEALLRVLHPLLHSTFSPDLAHGDYRLSFPGWRGRKWVVRLKRDSLENEVRLLFELPREIFAVAIDYVPSRWKKRVEGGGDHVEKVHTDNYENSDDE